MIGRNTFILSRRRNELELVAYFTSETRLEIAGNFTREIWQAV
jgi:hypothetical protein